MIGAVVVVVVLIVVIPTTVLMTGAVMSGILGWALKDDAEKRHEGSELLDLS